MTVSDILIWGEWLYYIFACHVVHYSYYELSSGVSPLEIISGKLTTTTFSFCHLYVCFPRMPAWSFYYQFQSDFVTSTKKNALKSPMVKAQILETTVISKDRLWGQASDDTNGLSQDLQESCQEADGFVLLLTQDRAERDLITQDWMDW